MPRKQTEITLPHLNNCNGDLERQWYVEFTYTLPNGEKKKECVYEGLSDGMAARNSC